MLNFDLTSGRIRIMEDWGDNCKNFGHSINCWISRTFLSAVQHYLFIFVSSSSKIPWRDCYERVFWLYFKWDKIEICSYLQNSKLIFHFLRSIINASCANESGPLRQLLRMERSCMPPDNTISLSPNRVYVDWCLMYQWEKYYKRRGCHSVAL